MAAPLTDEFLREQLFGKWLDMSTARRPVGLLWGRRPARQTFGTLTPKHPKRARREPENMTPITLSPHDEEALAHCTDQEGLTAAYGTDDNVVVSGDTLYISGTKDIGKALEAMVDIYANPTPENVGKHFVRNDLQDVWDDLKLPLNLTRFTQRYKEADAALAANPAVSKITGHSLGGAVALELEKNHPDRGLTTTTYGAPVATLTNDQGNRFRHPYDPVSMFDRGATTTTNLEGSDPHDFRGFAQGYTSTSTKPFGISFGSQEQAE
jgi:hypothetical protein